MEGLEESVCCATENERVMKTNTGVPHSDKTGTGVRGRDMDIEEGAGKEIGGRRNQMRMLRWMCGVSKLDKMRNERISSYIDPTS